MMQGKYLNALKSANKLAENVEPVLSEDPMLEGFYANPLFILISFSKWNEILNLPEADSAYKLYSALLHFSKGLAFAYTDNLENAKNQLAKFLNFKTVVPTGAYVGLTPASIILNLSEDLLRSKIAITEGDTSFAIALLKSAVEEEELVNYNEPPDWYPSVRLFLGSALYLNGDYVQAEQVFRDELKKYPHNGRGLYGLMESLKAQGKDDEAKIVSDEFIQVWKDAEVQLSMNGL
jgi:tetratricopeptide (TPR) repeat protein